MKQISFFPSSQEAYLTVPMPKPANNYIPKWYKDIKIFDGEKPKFYNGEVVNKNIKSCAPFFDAYNSGYIQETWCDIYVKINDEDFEFHYPVNPEIMSFRENKSMNLSDAFFSQEFVWKPQWQPKLDEGYSLLVTHPLNRIDLPFFTLSGIIDSDVYYHSPVANLPFYFYKNFEGIIPKGTPMFQIIPIKRDSWKSTKKVFDYDETYKKKTYSRSYFMGSYKRFFHKRKEYR